MFWRELLFHFGIELFEITSLENIVLVVLRFRKFHRRKATESSQTSGSFALRIRFSYSFSMPHRRSGVVLLLISLSNSAPVFCAQSFVLSLI